MVGDKTKKTTRRQQQDVFTEIRGPLASTKEHQHVYSTQINDDDDHGNQIDKEFDEARETK